MSPTGEQFNDFERVKQIMSSLKPPKGGNPRVLAIDQIPIMKAKTGGFPKDMYHPTLPPQLAIREDQQEELEKLGYSTTYIPRSYPKMLYRRNMDPKFDGKPDMGTGVPTEPEFLEMRVANDEAHEKRIRSERAPHKIDRETGKPYHVGPWVTKLSEVEDMPEGPSEDPQVTIARLEGEVQGLTRKKSA